jgi:hypothetical protein
MRCAVEIAAVLGKDDFHVVFGEKSVKKPMRPGLLIAQVESIKAIR